MRTGQTRWQQIAQAQAGEEYAAEYAERFRSAAAEGRDIHGEATFVAGLLDAPARVLDAGCGTGRIAVRLDELGYDVVGVDVDEAMLGQARAAAPGLDWRSGDLAALDLAATYDVVLLAGNILPLLEPGTLTDVCARLAAHAEPGGLVVCGFGLDDDHLPDGCPVLPLADVDRALAAAGLEPVSRFGTWDSGPFVAADGYVVTVHTRLAESA